MKKLSVYRIMRWLLIGTSILMIIASLFIPPYWHVDKSVWEVTGLFIVMAGLFKFFENVEQGKPAKFTTGWTIEFQPKKNKKPIKIYVASSWRNVALSLKQPWASLICIGLKDVENRTWQTDYRGRLFIVASSSNVLPAFEQGLIRKPITDAIQREQKKGNLPMLNALPQSAVIGYVDLVDCTGEEVESIWSEGSLEDGNINWILENAYIFDEPQLVGIKAKYFLFEIPELDPNNLPSAHKVKL